MASAVVNSGGATNPGANASGAGGSDSGTKPNADGTRADTSRAGDVTKAGDQNAGGGGAKKFEYTEDRSTWIPPHRLGEESTKRTAAEQRAKDLEQKLELENNRLKAAMGLTPTDPKAAERGEVKTVLTELLKEIIPGFEDFTKLKPGELQDAIQRASAASSASDQFYDRQRDETIGRVEAEMVKELGIEKLSPRQKSQLKTAFATEFSEDYAAQVQAMKQGTQREIDPASFVGRYLSGDPTLVTEFAKSFLEDWFGVATRKVTQTTVRRQGRPVPSGGRADTVVTKVPEVDFSDDKKFADALVAARRSGA